jgi:biotin carboxyl carrier protein
MEGQTLAIAAFNTKLDDDYQILTQDPEERAKIEDGMSKVAARIEQDMDPVLSAAQMDTDEIVRLEELRERLCAFAEMSYQSIGHRRVKNPRIWSIHDLNVLTKGVSQVGTEIEAEVDESKWTIPEGAEVLVAPMDGSFWSKPSPDQPPFVKVGQSIQIGQTIGLIEVMKTFTPIKATQSGVLQSWALEEGGACQVGQPIAILS